ncbi:MAG: NAD(P)/FAD-dependent oxidoreductase [Spirulina sp. SIO3F2]|nr:NAD(P)/FAD-dependent oxidoreductase [Spirulina sp. SIO3F2]
MQVIVIGGGAAGFFGAIACAQADPQAQITILEAASQPLGKVRISGGGRCNVTHHCFDPKVLIQHYPRGGKTLLGPFSRFQPQDTIAWFKQRGVALKTEADGRMFPVTDDSATIVDCLLTEAKRRGVQLRVRCPVRDLQPHKQQWQVMLKKGELLRGDRVLIATGSNPLGYRWAKQAGHTIISPVPSLFTFKVSDRRLTGLAGISVQSVQVQIGSKKQKLQQTGPLLITHWGVSGPAVLKLSAWGARWLHEQQYQLPLTVNWLPKLNVETVKDWLNQTKQQAPKRQVGNSSPPEIPKRLWQRFVVAAGLTPEQPWAEVSKKAIVRLAQELTQGQYQIQGKGVFKEEFVTCGGVKLAEVDFKTMASRKALGLFFAGEILDIDGVTGGFNFQNAWTTGWLAGQGMGQKSNE